MAGSGGGTMAARHPDAVPFPRNSRLHWDSVDYRRIGILRFDDGRLRLLPERQQSCQRHSCSFGFHCGFHVVLSFYFAGVNFSFAAIYADAP